MQTAIIQHLDRRELQETRLEARVDHYVDGLDPLRVLDDPEGALDEVLERVGARFSNDFVPLAVFEGHKFAQAVKAKAEGADARRGTPGETDGAETGQESDRPDTGGGA